MKPIKGLIISLRWNHFHWASLLLCIVITTQILTVYLNAIHEFNIDVLNIIRLTGFRWVGVFSIFYLIGLLFNLNSLQEKGKFFTAIILAASFLLWIQGSFFLWNYGLLDGRQLGFNAYHLHGIFEIILWGSIILFALFKYRILSIWAKKICLVIVAALMANMACLQVSNPPRWYKNATVSLDNYFTYSNKQNVIIVTIDAARGDIFEEIISEAKESEKSIFNGFTFFRNTTGTFNSTVLAVPGILTGHLYDCTRLKEVAYPDFFLSSSSLPYRLKQQGFISEIYPYAVNSVFLSMKNVDNLKLNEIDPFSPEKRQILLKDLKKIMLVVKFHFSPHFLKRWLFDSENMYIPDIPIAVPFTKTQTSKKLVTPELPPNIIEHLKFNQWIIDNLSSNLVYIDKPVFKYLHFHGAHPPFIHDENYQGKRLPFSMDSYKKQYKGSLLLTMNALITSLKRHGVFDKTMLIVIGDHGLHVPSAKRVTGEHLEQSIIDTLVPLLLIKPFGSISTTSLKISSAPVSLFDIPATVFDALGIPSESNYRSVFSIQEREHRLRKAYSFVTVDVPEYCAFEIEIDGDAHNAASWKPSFRALRRGKGIIDISQPEDQSYRKLLTAYLGNGEDRYYKDLDKHD